MVALVPFVSALRGWQCLCSGRTVHWIAMQSNSLLATSQRRFYAHVRGDMAPSLLSDASIVVRAPLRNVAVSQQCLLPRTSVVVGMGYFRKGSNPAYRIMGLLKSEHLAKIGGRHNPGSYFNRPQPHTRKSAGRSGAHVDSIPSLALAIHNVAYFVCRIALRRWRSSGQHTQGAPEEGMNTGDAGARAEGKEVPWSAYHTLPAGSCRLGRDLWCRL